MTWRCLLVPACFSVVILGGCASHRAGALPVSRDTPFALGLDAPEPEARVARAQIPERDRHLPPPPVTQATNVAPPRPQFAPPPAGPAQEERRGISVRAWVNNRPIFDEEVLMGVGRRAQEIMEQSPTQRVAYQTKVYNEELNQVIERELILQDAYRKLEKNQKVLDKLRQAARREFEKKVARIVKELQKKNGGTYEQVHHQLGKETLDTLRRQEERNFIASEYIRSRVHIHLQRVGHEDIRAYYNQHLSEFRTEDRVQWQNIFICVGGPHGGTAVEARRFAEQILDRVRRGERFDAFLHLDDGMSWRSRKGEGEGQQRGKIKPAELERYLFALKEGDVGPLVELSTGYHLFRVVKREYNGQLPFDDKVQLRIANKLRGEVAEREYKRVVKELRERAVIAIERPESP
ncbi:MAG: peptidyl-prolyl cis-trans isomerase [Gemmataceae bacterium]|nr:peptidyl-prolyl cis-trans isomerase [Gemmataceae bacterium]